MKERKNRSDMGFWRAARSMGFVIAVALGSATIATPAHANDGFDDAHSLRSLDIMLMVTALRCRSGLHDFQRDYHQFSANHSEHLTAAGRTLRRSLAASYGERNPERALDRMGVKIANSYGDGHPWLNCAELQQVTRELSQDREAKALAQKARYLLSASRPIEYDQAFAQKTESQAAQITYNMTGDWEKRP